MKNLNYGVIGNCESAALISEAGDIQWCCLPHFDSPSVFARLLDSRRGGGFSFKVPPGYETRQEYIKNTNILVTWYTRGNDCFRVIDFMPRYKLESRYHTPPDLIRIVKYISGAPAVVIDYDPRLGYAEYETETIIVENHLKSYTTKGAYDSVYLYSSFPLEKIIAGTPVTITRDYFFLLSFNQKILHLTTESINLEYERTKVYWLEWAHRTVEYSFYYDDIIRSALVLKLLTYQQTGAILAAVTTSLPETVGEPRNWDYRYCWIRDSSMIISILASLRHYNSAKRYIQFILNIIPYKNDKMQIMYGINGEKILTEKELSWLSGYENSTPVRIGNAAYAQRQNDIYGILLEVLYQFITIFKTDLDNIEDIWTVVRGLIRTVIRCWRDPDVGIWEFRGRDSHLVFSKVLCWVALDRGVKIASILNQQTIKESWIKERDLIKKDIIEKGWNEEVGAFTQAYGSKDMDAANLLIAHYGFLEYTDPRFRKTVLSIKDELSRNGLMYRYKNADDFGVPSSSFTVCTFWLIKSLYKIGEQQEARKMFNDILNHRNHLGLLSEDMDFETKRLLGNFPQGYSHLALIDTALTLTESRTEEEEILKFLDQVE